MKLNRQRISNWIIFAVALFTLLQGYRLQILERDAHSMGVHDKILQDAVQHMRSGMAIVSLDGNITEWSRTAEEITGWKSGEVVGKPINLLMPEEYREMHDYYLHDEATRKSLRKVSLVLDCSIVTREKDYLPVHLRISATNTQPESYLIVIDRGDQLKKIPELASPSSNPKAVTSFSDGRE